MGSKHGLVKNTKSFTWPPNSNNSTKFTAVPLAEEGNPDTPFYRCICALSFSYFFCKLLLPVNLSKASTLSFFIPFLKTPLCHISCKESSTAPRYLVSCHHSSEWWPLPPHSSFHCINVLTINYNIICNLFALTGISLFHFTQCLYNREEVTNASAIEIKNKL